MSLLKGETTLLKIARPDCALTVSVCLVGCVIECRIFFLLSLEYYAAMLLMALSKNMSWKIVHPNLSQAVKDHFKGVIRMPSGFLEDFSRKD